MIIDKVAATSIAPWREPKRCAGLQRLLVVVSCSCVVVFQGERNHENTAGLVLKMPVGVDVDHPCLPSSCRKSGVAGGAFGMATVTGRPAMVIETRCSPLEHPAAGTALTSVFGEEQVGTHEVHDGKDSRFGNTAGDGIQ